MTEFLTNHGVVVALVCAVCAVIYGAVTARSLLALSGLLASAEFVHTIYRLHAGEPEQRAPALVLHSDPSIPDRTAAILAGDTRELAARLAAALAALAASGAQRIVIACDLGGQLGSGRGWFFVHGRFNKLDPTAPPADAKKLTGCWKNNLYGDGHADSGLHRFGPTG